LAISAPRIKPSPVNVVIHSTAVVESLKCAGTNSRAPAMLPVS